jgi:CheY-like chemotaxis protein
MSTSRSTTVLLVDDRPEMRGLLRAYLALNFGQELLVAGEAVDGEEAVRLCEQLQPDLVVLDDKLPVLHGSAAIPLIRRSSPGSFVILHTAAPPAPLLHPPDRHVDKNDGLGPLGVALAEGARAARARIVDTPRQAAGG